MADARSGQPDPELVQQLYAMLPPEGQQLLRSILAGGDKAPVDDLLMRVAQATGRRPEELARILHQPGAVDRLTADLLAGGGDKAAEVADLLRRLYPQK